MTFYYKHPVISEGTTDMLFQLALTSPLSNSVWLLFRTEITEVTQVLSDRDTFIFYVLNDAENSKSGKFVHSKAIVENILKKYLRFNLKYVLKYLNFVGSARNNCIC